MDETHVFAINLVKRTDRKTNLLFEFSNRKEFSLTIVPAIEHQVGSFGLWQTICHIIEQADEKGFDKIIICEDDHVFTDAYTPEVLADALRKVIGFHADVLLGGVSWFNQVLQVSDGLFWVDRFNGAQFMVIFRNFYQTILTTDFQVGDNADFKISSLTDEIFVMCPFISFQREFGYSDVTEVNEEPGRITSLFNRRNEKLLQLDKVNRFYALKA